MPSEVLRQTYAGWPLKSLYCEEWLLDDKPVAQRLKNGNIWSTRLYELRYGFYRSVTVDFMSMGPMPLPRPVPLRPIWPGFAVNTVICAAILWLPIFGPFAVRRFLRFRRGLCPMCAYPMGETDVCSECGNELHKPAVA